GVSGSRGGRSGVMGSSVGEGRARRTEKPCPRQVEAQVLRGRNWQGEIGEGRDVLGWGTAREERVATGPADLSVLPRSGFVQLRLCGQVGYVVSVGLPSRIPA